MISCASSANTKKPDWVDNVGSVYNKSLYIAAVGSSKDRITAERNALANLSAVFGQSIQADVFTRNTYYEAARNGAITQWLDNTEIENVIKTSVSMDTLIGAEIKEVWYDEKNNTFYAAAVMERQRTIQLYTNLITANLRMINNLTNLDQTEKNTIEGLLRYRFAGTVADVNITYANLLYVLNAPLPNGVRSSDEYRLEAQNIAGTIPVNIIAPNDRESRISGAFAKIFTDNGFKIDASASGAASSGVNAYRYVLQINIALSQPVYPGNPAIFSQMELNVNLIDTFTNILLLPYSFTVRDGHNTAPLAEDRVFISAEQKINTEYREILSDYLNHLY